MRLIIFFVLLQSRLKIDSVKSDILNNEVLQNCIFSNLVDLKQLENLKMFELGQIKISKFWKFFSLFFLFRLPVAANVTIHLRYIQLIKKPEKILLISQIKFSSVI